MKITLKSILLFSVLLHSISSFSFTKGKNYNITILHISDTHGEFMPNKENHYGFSRLKYYADQVRQEVKKNQGILLILSSGDMNTGNPRSDLQKGTPDVEAFNEIGLDAMALGNHEFDLVYKDLMAQKELAKFEYLSANIYSTPERKKRPFLPHLIKDYSGLKISILGLTTEETNTQPKIDGFYFRPVLDEALDHIDFLKKKSDVVIGLTHMGYYPNGKHKPRTPGDITLARQFKNKFDLILGGHTHTKLRKGKLVGKTIISHTGDRGHHVARLDLDFKDGKLKLKKYQLISLKDGPQDKKLQNILDLYNKKGGAEISKKVGFTDAPLLGRVAELKRETRLGRLITRAQNDLLKSDVAIMSDRGIRDSIAKGDISYEDILRVLPFHNTICTFELTGSELKHYIENIPEILHFDGIRLVMKKNKILKMIIQGENVSFSKASEKRYKISLNIHNAVGGSSWPDQSKNPTFVDSGFDHAFVLKSYIEKIDQIKTSDFSQDSIVRIAN